MQRFVNAAVEIKKETAAELTGGCGISPLLAQMLLQRGITSKQEAGIFLHPSLEYLHDPALLPDMQAAVERMKRAIAAQEKICVYGDYDADGICATAMLAVFLEKAGADVHTYLPSRHHEGYGLHEDAVRELSERDIDLIITVDNGVTAIKEVELCSGLGMDVIITDHHQCAEVLPVCVAVVNPHRPDSRYPFPYLCGAGVVLKLIQALGGEAEDYIAVCALATVADIVMLKGENRIIVSTGLPLVSKHKGLASLLRVSGSAGQEVTSETLAFRLAPRLNAAGRMGDASRALRLLKSEDDVEVLRIALELNDENTRRQNEETQILRDIAAQLAHVDTAKMHAIVLCSEDWNAGIIGIVASRLVDMYYRPALLFHVDHDVLTGSCRSIPGVNILHCLQPFAHYFIRFGGHALAAGITMEKRLFNGFRNAFEEYLTSAVPPEQFLPTYQYECEMPIGALSIRDLETMQMLAPYGEGNPRPIFCAKNINLGNAACMGKDGQHARAMAMQGRDCAEVVAFGCGKQVQDWAQGGEFDMLYMPDLNEWQGNKRIQLQLKRVRRSNYLVSSGFTTMEQRKFYDAFFMYFLYNVTQAASLQSKPEMHAHILRALQSSICGMLILCITPDGAEELKTFLHQNGFADRVQVFWHRIPEDAPSYHTILLAPHREGLSIERFDEALYFDWPAAKGNSAKTIALERPNGKMLAPLDMTRKQMADIYKGFLRILGQGRVSRKELLLHTSAFGYEALLLALLTFIELGFMIWEPYTDMIERVSGYEYKNLMNSTLYAWARSKRLDMGDGKHGFEELHKEHTGLPERGHTVSGYHNPVEG